MVPPKSRDTKAQVRTVLPRVVACAVLMLRSLGLEDQGEESSGEDTPAIVQPKRGLCELKAQGFILKSKLCITANQLQEITHITQLQADLALSSLDIRSSLPPALKYFQSWGHPMRDLTQHLLLSLARYLPLTRAYGFLGDFFSWHPQMTSA